MYHPITIVSEALDALSRGDIERHLMYIADDVVLQEVVAGDVETAIRGRDAYTEFVTELKEAGVLTGFEIGGGGPTGDSWVRAVMHAREVLEYEDGTVEPPSIVSSDEFVEVRQGLIHSMMIFGRGGSEPGYAFSVSQPNE
ncbi:MAG: hypothetical protein WKH64_05135 [Chloroflexia bacterium]